MNRFFTAAILATLIAGCARPASERIKYTDEFTGREVWQLTQVDSSLMAYFENQAFTYDDSYVVFKSNRDGGVWKLFASDMKTGEVSKVSDRPAYSAYSIYATGDEVAFISGGVLYATNVKTHAERVLFDANGKVDEPKISANCIFTNDGDYTMLHGQNPDGSASIYRIRISTGEIEKLYSSPYGIAHPMINPEHPNLITFVCKPDMRSRWDLSKEERARGKLIDTDKGTIVPFVMSEMHYRATHETWSKDGERLYYFDKWHRYSNPKPTAGWEISVVSINKDGGDRQEHYINRSFKLSHGIGSTDGRFFICDVEEPEHNPLILLDFETGEAQIICWANQTQRSKGNAQSEHAHPLFSRSGKYVAFTSDRNTIGRPQAFVVPVADITCR